MAVLLFHVVSLGDQFKIGGAMRLATLAAAFIGSALAGSYCWGSAGGQILYAIGSGAQGGGSQLYQISNYATAPASVGNVNTNFTLSDIAVDPITGFIYAVRLASGGEFFRLDPNTGAAAFIGSTPGIPNINALEFDQAGQAYGWSEQGILYRINKVTGAATTVGPVGFASGGDLAFDADGTLYGATINSLIRIDPATGAGTLIGMFGIAQVYGLEIDLDGTMYAGVHGTQPQLYKVDKATGATTLVGAVAGPSDGVYGLAFSQTPIPEPAAAVLVLPAVALLARRRGR
jgi:hypothetical protein